MSENENVILDDSELFDIKKKYESMEKASEEVLFPPERRLEADMKKLASVLTEIESVETRLAKIQSEVDGFLEAEGLMLLKTELTNEKAGLRQEFDLLKKDIAERGLDLCAKSNYENRDPAPGVKIKRYNQEQLEVHIEEAVTWAVDHQHYKLLTIEDEAYLNVLKTGVLEGQPGTVNDTPEYKATISLKPYMESDD